MLKNLYTAAFYEKSCFLVKILVFVTAFLMHLSGYMIAIIGVDRYCRIKYYVKFKNLWSAKIVLIFICSGSLLAFFQVVMITVGLVLELDRFVVPVYFTMDLVVVGVTIILQVKLFEHQEMCIICQQLLLQKESIRKSQN